MSILIKTEQLMKIFKNGESSLTVLNQVNIEVEKGEFVALTGPSGSGKTTLLHILGCLDQPSSGHYFLDNQDVSTFSPKQLAHVRNQKIGFVFQNFHLLNDLNSIENVVLPQLYGQVPEKKACQKALELLTLVGLQDRFFHYPYQLSGGQRQRMAIARALALDPLLILADEPTGNLDSENTQKILELFFQINQTQKTTIIMVTHEKQISQAVKRCITIQDGCIASDIYRSDGS